MSYHNCRDLLCVTPHYAESIETGFTDKTIVIECGECGEKIEGVETMQVHILDTHIGYSAVEAVQHARIWADSAYEQAEEDILNQEPDYDDRGD